MVATTKIAAVWRRFFRSDEPSEGRTRAPGRGSQSKPIRRRPRRKKSSSASNPTKEADAETINGNTDDQTAPQAVHNLHCKHISVGSAAVAVGILSTWGRGSSGQWVSDLQTT